jgi:hypothetical protein
MSTYYISTTGNDTTGSGTSVNPWKTLYKATSTVTSGNTIYVSAGTYVETTQSVLAAGVSLSGAGTTSIIKNNTINSEFVQILDMASAEGTNGNQTIANLKFDGQMINYWGIYIAGRSNVSIHDVTIIDFINRGVLFNGRNDNVTAPPTIYATGNTFYNNIVTNCAEYDQGRGYGSGCLNIGGQDGMIIRNNVISQDSRPCGHNGWPIKAYVEGYLKGCKIFDNTLNKIMNCYTEGDLNWDFAIELFNEQGLHISGNTLNGGGIDLNFQNTSGYSYSVWIHNNVILMPSINANSLQTAITLEYETYDAIIENNIIDKCTVGVLFTPRDGSNVTGVTIQNNLIKNTGFGQGTGYHIQFGGTANHIFENINVYNNTMVMDPVHYTWWGIGLPMATSGRIKNINIKNNIIARSISGGIVLGGGTVAIENLHIQYNGIFANGNNNDLVNNGGTSPTPSPGYLWTNNITGTTAPIFGGWNYSLTSGSTLIDAGVDVGLPFYGSAPNINWIENVTPQPPTDYAGIDQVITLPTSSITLSGTGTAASGATITGYSWVQLYGTTGTIVNPTSAVTTITGLTTTGSFQLTVTDNYGGTATDSVIIVITNPGGCGTLDPTQAGAGVTLSGGNLTAIINNSTVLGTIPLIGQKYFEVKVESSPYFSTFGVASLGVTLGQYTGYDSLGWALYVSNFGSPSQDSMHNGGGSHFNNNPLNIGDIIGVTYDSITGTMNEYRNGSLIGTLFTTITGTVFPAIGSATNSGTQFTVNFGATSFAYTPPSGYTGLCSSSALVIFGPAIHRLIRIG